MALCTKTSRSPAYPKLLGLSRPRGKNMSLKDMGPDFKNQDARYVLTVDAKDTPFPTESAALDAWMETFRTMLNPVRAA